MAVSRLNTYGLLEQWRAEMDVNIWHYNQLTGAGANAPLAVPGQFVYVQPEREKIAEALLRAVSLALPRLRFYPRPAWLHETIRLGKRRPLHAQEIRTRYRYLAAIGQRALTALAAEATPASVVYSDPDLTGTDTLATITVTGLPAAVTEASEVQVFFTPSDSLGTAGAEVWRIEPLEVVLNGTTATITGHRALFAQPSLWRTPYLSTFGQPSKNDGDVQNPADFVTQVDVYRVYADASAAVTLKCKDCCSASGFETTTGSAYIVDAEEGLIGLSPTTCGCSSNRETFLDVYYFAGFPASGLTGLPDETIPRALVHLANAKMSGPVGTDDAGVNRWYYDKAVFSPQDLQAFEVRNPFGLEYGSLAAWGMLEPYIRTGGGALR